MEEEERIFRNYIFVDTNRVKRFFTAENAAIIIIQYYYYSSLCIFFHIFIVKHIIRN